MAPVARSSAVQPVTSKPVQCAADQFDVFVAGLRARVGVVVVGAVHPALHQLVHAGRIAPTTDIGPGYRATSYFTTVSAQPLASFSRAARSLSSAVSFQRSFVPTQSAPYVHWADAADGSHSAGSRSALLLLVFAVTATRGRSASRSFAYCSRRSASHFDAPTGGERHSNRAVFETAGGVGKVSAASAMVRGRGRY